MAGFLKEFREDMKKLKGGEKIRTRARTLFASSGSIIGLIEPYFFPSEIRFCLN